MYTQYAHRTNVLAFTLDGMILANGEIAESCSVRIFDRRRMIQKLRNKRTGSFVRDTRITDMAFSMMVSRAFKHLAAWYHELSST